MGKILVVEDEDIVRSNIVELLDAEGYEVEEAPNGSEALKILNSYKPDLIISDVMMPIVDGYELLRRLQENPLSSSIPVILLTARADSTDRRMGMNIGADDYITKPFRSSDLLHAVEARLRKQTNYNKKLEELKTHVATYIPHELRTPLVSILGFAELIISNLDDLSKEEIGEMAEKVKNSGVRLYDRIEKFLYFSDLELIKTSKVDNVSTNIDEKYIIDFLSSRFRGKDISCIKFNIESAKASISEDYLDRVLFELVDNSFKFCDENCEISITGYSENDRYILEVKDNGIGMEETDIEQIEAFKQFNREEYQQHGTGLGLAIVKNIIQITNGDLEIDSTLTEYTSVRCIFHLD